MQPVQAPPGRVTSGFVIKQLVADGLLSTADAERFKITGGSARSGHPLVVLAEMNYRSPQADRQLLDLETLTRWIAEKAALPYFHIDPLKVDFTRVVDVMSSSYATTYSILPVAMTPTEVTIATSEPFLTGWDREIEQITKKSVLRVVANPLDVARYTTEFFKLAQQVRGAAKTGSTALVSSFEQLVELGGKVDANDAHVIHIVDWLLQYAFDQRASDIHLEPRREFGVARFRIDGVLHQVYQVPAGVMGAMTSRIKLLGRMDVIEKRRPQDGRIKTKVTTGPNAGREVEIRLSTLPTAFGEKLVMRIFDPEVVVRSYAELGFANEEAKLWESWIHRPSGIVLVTGPTGFGQDDDAVFDAEAACDRRSQRQHRGRPDRNGRSRAEPDAGAARHRSRLRRRPACVDAAGPGHHHGRRDPRQGNRRHGGAGRADRPSGVLDAAHERCCVIGCASARARRAELSGQCDVDRHSCAAPDPHAMPALQGDRRADRSCAVERTRQSLALEYSRQGLQAGGLPRVPQHRLHAPHRVDRDAGDDRRDACAGRTGGRHRQDAQPGRARWFEVLASFGRPEDCERADHD